MTITRRETDFARPSRDRSLASGSLSLGDRRFARLVVSLLVGLVLALAPAKPRKADNKADKKTADEEAGEPPVAEAEAA